VQRGCLGERVGEDDCGLALESARVESSEDVSRSRICVFDATRRSRSPADRRLKNA